MTTNENSRASQLVCLGLIAIGLAGYALDEHVGAATLHQKVNLALAAIGFAFLRVDVAPVREKWALAREIIPWFRRSPPPALAPDPAFQQPFDFKGDDKPVNDQ